MKIYYHNDADGRCGGAIVYRLAPRRISDPIELIEIDYKDEIDVGAIRPKEEIVIVDFSFKPEVMAEVLDKTTYVTWIDHHKTAFEYDYGICLEGLRDNRYSGCELAWMFYHDLSPEAGKHLEEQIPEAVLLIGDRDKWAWKYGERTAEFNMGLGVYNHHADDDIWPILFGDGATDLVEEMIHAGYFCIRFRDNFCRDYADSYGFEASFEGYRCFALGLNMFGSEAFGRRMKGYDICLSFEFSGQSWTVGLYSEKVDVSEIAKRYGGGGHRGAAGFVCDELPFGAK